MGKERRNKEEKDILRLSEILKQYSKYFDCFGARFNFFTERNRKLYTPLGGILKLLSFIFSIILFIYINLDDFLHNLPNTTTSTERQKLRKIIFKNEKICIFGVFVNLNYSNSD